MNRFVVLVDSHNRLARASTILRKYTLRNHGDHWRNGEISMEIMEKS